MKTLGWMVCWFLEKRYFISQHYNHSGFHVIANHGQTPKSCSLHVLIILTKTKKILQYFSPLQWRFLIHSTEKRGITVITAWKFSLKRQDSSSVPLFQFAQNFLCLFLFFCLHMKFNDENRGRFLIWTGLNIMMVLIFNQYHLHKIFKESFHFVFLYVLHVV